ncbi:MAG: hypothetical protein HUJ86_00450, partial [Synergistes sp.]|nr:hypothetical protein [Synergistes sp.]
MWHNFTERSKRVFQLAQNEALHMGHEVIGTEHILLGLLHDEYAMIDALLDTLEVSRRELIEEIRMYAGT